VLLYKLMSAQRDESCLPVFGSILFLMLCIASILFPLTVDIMFKFKFFEVVLKKDVFDLDEGFV